MLTTLLFAILPARAADLDLRVQLPERNGGVETTLSNIQPGAQAPLEITGKDGQLYRLHIDIASGAQEAEYVLGFRLDEVKRKRSGKERVETLYQPTLKVPANREAFFSQGRRVPIPGTDPVEFENLALEIEATVRE